MNQIEKESTLSTLGYYNKNAEAFIKGTVHSDMSYCYHMFLKYLTPGQSILDLGCGSGRDSKFFLNLGFEVVAIDGSEEICKQASDYIGKEVICKRFEDITYENEFDGIWASASLLHVRRDELPGLMKLLSKALKKNGYLYASFKYGVGERMAGERFFSDYTEQDIDLIFHRSSGLKCLEWQVADDVRADRKGERWLNLIAKKEDNGGRNE